MLRSDVPRIVLAVLCAVVVLPAAGCGSSDAAIAVSPTTHDFGDVHLGDTRRHTFVLRNDSARTLGFRAKANCSCFKVAQSLRPLDPGKELAFTVIFETARLSPKKLTGKYITIATDDPDIEPLIVPLTGQVIRTYDIRPTVHNRGRIVGRPEDYEPFKVLVRPLAGHTAAFEGIVATPDVFDVESEPVDAGGIAVALRLRKDTWRPLGTFLAQVRLKLAITSPEGAIRREEPVVTVKGFWAVTQRAAKPGVPERDGN